MAEEFDDITQALTLINAGAYDGAITLLDGLIATTPNHHQALFLKGEAFRQSGDNPTAEALFARVLQLVPIANGEILYRLGLTQLAQGRPAAAEQALAAAAEQLPDHAPVWLSLNLALLQQGQLGKAEQVLRRAVANNPSSVDLLLSLTDCLDLQNKKDEATAILEAVVMLAADRTDIAQRLLQAYVDEAHYDAAKRLVATMVERFPDSAHWRFVHSWLLLSLGRLGDAVTAGRQATVLQPDSAEYAAHLGATLRQADLADEAAEVFHQALTLDPNSLNATLGLASVQLDAGRFDLAADLVEAFDRRTAFPRGATQSVVIPVLDYSPGSPYNIRTLLDDLSAFTGEVICIFNDVEVFNDLRDHPRIDKFSFNKHNVGVARAWNMGINQAEGETIHILNADLKISVPMLYRLERWLLTLPDALCVGVSAHWTNFQTLKETKALNTGSFAEPIEADQVSGQLFSLHARRLHDAGISFDPRLSPYFGEETDLAIKARQSGYKIYAVPETDFVHTWGISKRDRPILCFGRPVHRLHCMTSNQTLLQRKWHSVKATIRS